MGLRALSKASDCKDARAVDLPLGPEGCCGEDGVAEPPARGTDAEAPPAVPGALQAQRRGLCGWTSQAALGVGSGAPASPAGDGSCRNIRHAARSSAPKPNRVAIADTNGRIPATARTMTPSTAAR